MARIETAEDAWMFMGAIIAFTPQSCYYGKERSYIPNNKIVLGLLDNKFFPYGIDGKYLNLYLFQKPTILSENIVLTASTLKLYENGYLNIRFANLEEIKSLRHLIDSNYIILNNFNKVDTICILNNILYYDSTLNLLNISYNQDTFDITLEWYKDREKDATKTLGNDSNKN